MRILILGSGGREHALAWKIAQSPLCSHLFCAPGNGGTTEFATNVPVSPLNFSEVAAFCLEESIELVVVGPEEPLGNGIVDYFKKNPELEDILVFGPDASGARLEISKQFAKRFMQHYDIPTATYRSFTSDALEEALNYIHTIPPPFVIKADGLAAGKGVVITEQVEEAVDTIRAFFSGTLGKAGERIVIEQFLDGIEYSVFVITDGHDYQVLPVAKDYKRIGEQDTGPNTGGMGAVSPPPFISKSLWKKTEERIIRPSIQGIEEHGMLYKGFLFIGCINVGGDPYVIEYNCRMGDPETQVVLPRLRNDLVLLILSTFNDTLKSMWIDEDPRFAVTTICASGGYPGAYQKGYSIDGLWQPDEDIIIFHAGTEIKEDEILTAGGRVCACTAMHPTLPGAIAASQKSAARIHYKDKVYRKDIGRDCLMTQ